MLCDSGRDQRTAVKNRDRRKADGHSLSGRSLAARSQEPTTASTRPTRFSTGNIPTPLRRFVLTMGVMYVALNLLIDILYGVIDPRMRVEA